MTVISGKNSIIDGRQGVGSWRVQWISTDAGIVHSTSEGATIRLPGNVDWKGVYQSYGHTPITMPGTKFTFKGEGANGKGMYSAASGTIVERVDIIWDLLNARPIYHNCYFAANGVLTLSDDVESDSGANPTNAAYAAPLPSKGMLTKFGSDTAVPNVFYMMLSLVAPSAEYVDSSTAGQMQREEGNFDAFWIYRRNLADPDELPDIDDIAQLRLYVTSDTFWDLHDAIVKRVVPVYSVKSSSDREAKIVSATVAGKMNIIDATDYLANPATTKWIDFTD